jgi:tRNA (guanine37-N1)-methyltransferase
VKFTALSLFPEVLDAYFASSIMAKAVDRGLIEYKSVNIRDFALDKHHSCDDAPYGGGAGMLMLCEPIGGAFESVGVPRRAVTDGKTAGGRQSEERLVVYLSPSGESFNQELAAELAREKELVLLCGRYEGVDQRAIDLYVDREISIGSYVLSSGEVAALALIDSVYRLIDGVITQESLAEESFSGNGVENKLLEYPQWTRPPEYGNLAVPEVLLSGHHENIRKWRLNQRMDKTQRIRPEIFLDIARLGDEKERQELREIIKGWRGYINERNTND